MFILSKFFYFWNIFLFHSFNGLVHFLFFNFLLNICEHGGMQVCGVRKCMSVSVCSYVCPEVADYLVFWSCTSIYLSIYILARRRYATVFHTCTNLRGAWRTERWCFSSPTYHLQEKRGGQAERMANNEMTLAVLTYTTYMYVRNKRCVLISNLL